MQIGAMNHPQRDPISEIKWIAEIGLDFIDLTLEPPAAASWKVDAKQIRAALEDYGLGVVGHTAYYLPMGSPIEELRKASIEEFKRCLDQFAAIGAKWMNLHPDRYAPMHPRSFFIERDLQSLRELMPYAQKAGVGMMLENLPGDFNTVEQLSELLDPLPELGFHLDIGHANLRVERNTSDELVQTFKDRLKHVHLHDNKGGDADLHLPLGVGTMNVKQHVRALKQSGYDGTITLEVFSEDPARHYLRHSRDVLREMWERL